MSHRNRRDAAKFAWSAFRDAQATSPRSRGEEISSVAAPSRARTTCSLAPFAGRGLGRGAGRASTRFPPEKRPGNIAPTRLAPLPPSALLRRPLPVHGARRYPASLHLLALAQPAPSPRLRGEGWGEGPGELALLFRTTSRAEGGARCPPFLPHQGQNLPHPGIIPSNPSSTSLEGGFDASKVT